MLTYQICPKCNGQGIVSKPPWIPGDINEWTDSGGPYACDVCKGAKIIAIPDDQHISVRGVAHKIKEYL